MNVDLELMFECLIYLNTFYYPVFASCESIMAVAKYFSRRDTPNIGQDAGVVFSRLFGEILKIIIFRKFKEEKRGLATVVAVVLSMYSICAILFTFLLQDPVLKLEYILGILSLMLHNTEVVFGILYLLPCCRKVQYY